MILFGFEDDASFLTANRVYYTATGLRAMNARSENLWLEVER